MSIERNFILSLILLLASTPATAATILVMGDSLSAAYGIELERGWVNLLRARLRQTDTEAQWRVINASVSGETTAGGLARLPDLLDQYRPALCIIELGANDGLRGLSLERMRLHLNRMTGLCGQYGEVLLLGMKLPPNYGGKYARGFAQTFTLVAEQNNIALVPFFLDGVALKPEYMQADELHPTAAAQALILENIWPSLSELLEAL